MINPLLKYTEGKSIGFFGIGKSNLAILSEVFPVAKDITLRSDAPIDRARLPKELVAPRVLEKDMAAEGITEKIIFFSPSVRRDRYQLLSALGRGVEFTSDIEFFLKHNKRPFFTVTGTDGKTTVTTLAAQILDKPDSPARAVGNIGEVATMHLEDDTERFVIEMSSFMLEYAMPMSERAVITSLSEDHLAWHRGYDGYKSAKRRATLGAKESVISMDSPDLAEMYRGERIFAATSADMTPKEMKRQISADHYFGIEDGYITENGRRLIAVKNLKKREAYNIKSYLSALALTFGYADEDKALTVISSFSGIEHRGEFFLDKRGIKFINSSIDTSPTRTVQTIAATDGNIILLLGGRSKGLDYEPLKKAIKGAKIKAIISFGESAEQIRDRIACSKVMSTEKLGDATDLAMTLAKAGDTVLLSPSATSYDEFSSFEERGTFFKNRVLSTF